MLAKDLLEACSHGGGEWRELPIWGGEWIIGDKCDRTASSYGILLRE